MIEDLAGIEAGRTSMFDLCLVGAGPAGITIAHELIGSGLRVCLLEAGGYRDEARTQALYQGESIGHPVQTDEGRYRLFGGSATRWGGRCAMLDPIDFEARDWVRHSGWPITFASLQPYYARAAAANNFQQPWIDDAEVPSRLGISLPEFASPDVQPFVWRYASPDLDPSLLRFASIGYRRAFDWGRAYRRRLKADPDTHVVLHANMTGFTTNAEGSVIEAITARSLANVCITIRARAFVLCCGGIENVRLLLNAPEPMLRRINAFDTLGRYLAQHPRGCIATLHTSPETAWRLQSLLTTFFRPRRVAVQYEIGLALSEPAQRRHRILNASAALYYEAGADTSWKAGRRLRDAVRSASPYKGMLGDAARVAGGMPSVAANIGRRFIRSRPILLARPQIQIVADLEQEPNPDSRITLGDSTDALGMRRCRVDWRLSEIERTTARQLSRSISAELRRLRLGETCEPEWLTRDGPIADGELRGTYHFIGATRMSSSPRDGVVNEDCRAHGMQNLYLAGCSVFPTGGHANPTLSIVALAIRLADHLRAALSN